jgi:hypothetical protein
MKHFKHFHEHFTATHGYEFFTAIHFLNLPHLRKVAVTAATWQPCCSAERLHEGDNRLQRYIEQIRRDIFKIIEVH